MSVGSRSWIESYDAGHLEIAASRWSSSAEQLEYHAEGIHSEALRPGGTVWEGTGADAAVERTWGDVVKARSAADAMYGASAVAREGAPNLMWAKGQAVDAISSAESAGFTVSEDLSITDPRLPFMPALVRPARIAQAQAFSTDIAAKAQTLVAMDQSVAGEISSATSPLNALSFNTSTGTPTMQAAGFHHLKQDGPTGDTPKPADPKITSITPTTNPQAADPLPPGQKVPTDLNDTTPDWPHTVTGDGLHSYPLVDGQDSPIKPGDNRRPLPTGVGRDANDNPIVGIATPQYHPDGTNAPDEFTTKDTQVWNFADPKKPVLVGTLTDKAQASVSYNKAEHQWVVVGNDGPGQNAPRHVWTAPDTPGSNRWMNNLTDQGVVPLGGDRENQYIPLKGGGTMLLDAANGRDVQAYVSGGTQGLTAPGITATPIRTDFAGSVQPPLPDKAPKGSTWSFSPAYGATVTNDVVHGNTETVTIRVSTWGQVVPPPGVALPPELSGNANNYFPRTYSYNVEIQH